MSDHDIVTATCDKCQSSRDIQVASLRVNRGKHDGLFICGTCAHQDQTPSDLNRAISRETKTNKPRSQETKDKIKAAQLRRGQEAYLKLPWSLRGTELEVRTHTCHTCGATWDQDCGNARQQYKIFNDRLVCGQCKRTDTNRRDMVEVICEDCHKPYMVTMIAVRMSRRNGTPHRCGSCRQLGKQIGPEQRAKISAAMTGRKLSDETKAKISERSRQPDITEQLREFGRMRKSGEMAPSTLGRVQPADEIERRRMACTGLKRSPEACANISNGRKAMLAAQGGILPEVRLKISATVSRLRSEGFKPEKGHIQERYTPAKPQAPFPGAKPKTPPYTLSSSWESTYARWLDANPDVICWSYEASSLEMDTGSYYLPDFVWVGIDGLTRVVEVKPARKLERNTDGCHDKWVWLQGWCASYGYLPLIVDENALVLICDELESWVAQSDVVQPEGE